MGTRCTFPAMSGPLRAGGRPAPDGRADLRTHTLEKARAVLADMAGGLNAREAAEKHDVKENWADKLVRAPSRELSDAPWYAALVKPIRERRAKRRGGRALVMPERRRM